MINFIFHSLSKQSPDHLNFLWIKILDIPLLWAKDMDIITKNECNEKRKAENGHKNQDVVRESYEHSLSAGIDAKEAEHHEQ